MKYIIAIIQPDRLEEVMDALNKAEIHLITVSQVIAVNDEYLNVAMAAIIHGARTGNIGDGKIFVLDLQDCLRIRTGEEGVVAIG
jgi:nitrogen regulatory protein P-II 1